jgi:hypothetical protein
MYSEASVPKGVEFKVREIILGYNRGNICSTWLMLFGFFTRSLVVGLILFLQTSIDYRTPFHLHTLVPVPSSEPAHHSHRLDTGRASDSYCEYNTIDDSTW